MCPFIRVIIAAMNVFLLVFCLLLSFGSAAPAAGPATVGYLEGRVTAVDRNANLATVELSDGSVVEATTGTPLPDEMQSPLPPFRVGDRAEVYYSPGPGGGRAYAVSDWVRRPALGLLALLFLVVSVAIGRAKGLRASLATTASLGIAVGFVVPGILAGWNPVPVSLLGAGGILLLAIFFVHGVS